MGSHV